jgi:hypothetical protein
MDEKYIENSRLIVRFDCQAVVVPDEKNIIPPKKPKIAT